MRDGFFLEASGAGQRSKRRQKRLPASSGLLSTLSRALFIHCAWLVKFLHSSPDSRGGSAVDLIHVCARASGPGARGTVCLHEEALGDGASASAREILFRIAGCQRMECAF